MNDPEPQGGVFGNLPGSRPGARSPRRRPQDDAPRSSEPQVAAPPGPEPVPEPTRAEREQPPEPDPETEPRPGAGLEDLAWAGVAIAAEAATLGVRLASRAMGALRTDDDDRR